MVDAEVPMSMGDIVVMKGEEGDPSNSHKTQVVLHLQSISQGANEDNADTGTTVLAVETHQEDNSSEGEEVEYGYPITCGDSKAVLLFKKFVCPGINVKCVKFNDQLISPKQFVHMAGKATLKDWKRAIRLGGVMLRKMMDSGQIDFYQHDTVCTNSCRSTKFDLLISNTRFPPGSTLQTPPSPLPGNGGQVAEERSDEMVSVVMETCPTQVPPVAIATNGEVKGETEDVSEETLSFWKGIADMGLMGEVVSNIRTELLAMLRGVERRSEQASLQEADAAVLNTLTQMFGLLDSVRRVLDMERSRTHESQEQVHNTLNVLEGQLYKQKKPWRPKPQPFPSAVLHSVEGSSKPPPAKRPRLLRPSSASTLTSSPSQFTVLSPITLAPVGQPLNVAGLPIATLAQLPTGSQLFTRHHNTVGGRGKAQAVALRPARGITLLGATTEAAEGSPVEVLHLTLEGEVGAGEGQEGGVEDASGVEIDPEQGEQGAEAGSGRVEQADEEKRREEEREGMHDVEIVIIGEEVHKKRVTK